MAQRKTPSLHIRFDGFRIIDKLEIWANRRGMKIVPWSRQALLKQATEERVEETVSWRADVAALETLALLREQAGPEAAQRAYDHTQNYI